MVSDQELMELYLAQIPDGTSFEDASRMLNETSSIYQDEFRVVFCDDLLYAISMGYIQYEQQNMMEYPLVRLFCDHAQKLPKDNTYFRAVRSFYQKRYEDCLELIGQYLKSSFSDGKTEITEFVIVDWFFEPFKNAFPGFWSFVREQVGQYRAQPGVCALCGMIEEYYNCRTDEDALELLLSFAQRYPDIRFVEELIGYTYFSLKKWYNAAACFEAMEDQNLFFRNHHLWFMMGFCYGKIRNKQLEEAYYRKCLEERPGHLDALNNLGYCLYQQKRHSEAKSLFEQCLEIDADYAYAANNLVRTLIALGRNKDAKAAVRKGYKISKSLKDRVNGLDDKNAKMKTPAASTDLNETAIEESYRESGIDLGIKRQQFSSEKLLEDELTARIEAGMDVFGMHLKIYRRKGLYGRQFRIPVGRLDLLCEDENGNLYIIELKKDSGYDDAYEQTVRYLEWFDGSEYAMGRKIYGIICLNSPGMELIGKVRRNPRIRLFEYQISYREI